MLIERLSRESGLDRGRLRFFAESASRRYYVFSIPKATGGYRQIAHPSRPLKSVQRWLNANYLSKLPVHTAATAYRRGSNIRVNAERHANFRFTLRIDFRDFFPNFSMMHVFQFLSSQKAVLEMNEEDAFMATLLVSRNGGLTIGSPSSPVLTNAMMYEFDEMLAGYCADRNLNYTRYADDMFISTNQANVLSEALEFVKDIASSYKFAKLRINRSKTAFLSRKYHREITGLTITPEGGISIGRARKRELKALVHKFLRNELPRDREAYLEGMLSFVSDVEPTFLTSLIAKYDGDFRYLFRERYAAAHTTFSALEMLDPPDESR